MKVIELIQELNNELKTYTKLGRANEFLNSDVVLELSNCNVNFYSKKVSLIGFLEDGDTLMVGTLDE